ncbi:MAG: 3-keto-5-aminohexanoate cleavage protein [marine bacterium B5-7]|nr:MAG: 3-keto-5-aminohexanoate cleavage protein [marine bacterium B5-7]
MSKIIITCAVTGSVHTPTMTPYLPITPREIAREGIDASAAGASILHLHARDPDDGRPSSDPALFMDILTRIKSECGAICNVTTGGSAIMNLDDRLAGARAVSPEMCSLNLGSMNFGLFGAVDRYDQFKHPWEKPFLEGTRDLVFKNTFADMEQVFDELGKANGTRFEFECYDVGHLYTLAHFVDKGQVKPPFFIQFVFGILGGIGADIDNLTHMRHIADKLFGGEFLFSVLAAGRHQIPMTTAAAAMGGHVRVGLEDSIHIARGELAKSNADQVTKIRGIVESLGREIATPAEVRQMLNLKGADNTRF